MKRLGIKEFQIFVKGKLSTDILERYKTFQILCEADLQCHVWQILNDYFSNDDRTKKMICVLNRPYLKEIGIHPDIVIFRRKKPWIIFELKEWKKPKQRSAVKDFDRILNAKKHFSDKYNYRLQRGYLLYVSRRKVENLFTATNKPDLHYINAVPIILEDHMKPTEIFKWEQKFAQWSKYITKPKNKSSIT